MNRGVERAVVLPIIPQKTNFLKNLEEQPENRTLLISKVIRLHLNQRISKDPFDHVLIEHKKYFLVVFVTAKPRNHLNLLCLYGLKKVQHLDGFL